MWYPLKIHTFWAHFEEKWWWAELLSRPVFSDFHTFWVTCHTRCHIIKLTATLLFRQSYFTVHIYLVFISFVILFCFRFFRFLSHSCSCCSQCHAVARVTDNVTANVSVEAISTFTDLSEIIFFHYFLFFVSLCYLQLFVSFVFILSWSLVLGGLGLRIKEAPQSTYHEKSCASAFLFI